MTIPLILFQIALIIIIIRSVFVITQLVNARLKNWLDIFFQGSVIVLCLYFLL